MDINGIPFKQGEMKIGTLGVQKGESVEKSNEDSSVEYKEGRKGLFGSSGSLKTVDVDRSEQSYLKANMEQLMDEAKEYSKNVDMTNISQALFVAQDLSETGDEAAQKKAGNITKNAKNCIENDLYNLK